VAGSHQGCRKTVAPTNTPQVKRAVMAMQHNNALQKTNMTKKHDAEKINKPSM
jgi:hypothetical protein